MRVHGWMGWLGWIGWIGAVSTACALPAKADAGPYHQPAINASLANLLVPTLSQVSLPPDAQIQEATGQLNDATAPDQVRKNAAALLVKNASNPAAFQAVEASLALPLSGVGGGRYVLDVLLDDSVWPGTGVVARVDGDSPDTAPPSGTFWPPEVLLAPLAAKAARADREEAPKLFAALSRYPSRFAAKVLLDKTNGDVDDVTANAAFAALRALSGRQDLPDDSGAWRAWLTAYDNVHEAQWQRSLAANHARAARMRSVDSERYIELLVTSQRKLYLATPEQERPTFLLELLMQREPAIAALRGLGFELCQRELSNKGTLDERIGAAALLLLSDPSPLVRSPAAVLVRQLTPLGSADAIVGALNRETDPQAASDLLLAAARTPTPDAVTAVMNWVLRDSDARPAALEAVLRITRVVDLSDQDRTSLLTLLRSALGSVLAGGTSLEQPNNSGGPPGDLTAAGVELLAALGSDEDRSGLSQLLRDDFVPVLRSAAADALVWYPEYTGTIVESARTHPELVPIAIKAVTVQNPTAAQLKLLLMLNPVGDGVVRPELGALVRVMNADEVLPALDGLRDPALRTLLLTSLASPARYLAESGRPSSLEAICKGAILLAEESLSRGDAALALSTLDSSPHAEIAPVTADTAHELRLTALLALGRIEDARRVVGANPELERNITPWLRGADLAMATPAGPRTAAYVDAALGSVLTPEQRIRFQAAADREFLIGPPAPPARARE